MQNKTELTMKDWADACVEIQALNDQVLTAKLDTIIPSILKGLEPPNNTLISFSVADLYCLDAITGQLNNTQAKFCPQFLKLHSIVKNTKLVKPDFYSDDIWNNYIVPKFDTLSVSRLMRTCSFFSVNPTMRLFRDQDHPVLSMFKGTPTNLLTSNHIKGLTIMCSTKSSRFQPENIQSLVQVTDISGALKAIGFYCTEDPIWLERVHNSIGLMKWEDLGGTYYVEFCQKGIWNLRYVQLFDKLKTSSERLEEGHLDTLNTLLSVVEAIPFTNPFKFEIRLADFDKETKTASGPVKSVMLKITLCPDSMRGSLKTKDEFEGSFIPEFKEQLGAENFTRLVKLYGKAVDGTVFIEFPESELKKAWLLPKADTTPTPQITL